MMSHPRLTRACRLAVCGTAWALVGGLVSAVVAWSAAVWTPTPVLKSMHPRVHDLEWSAAVPMGWPQPTSRTIYASRVHTCLLERTIHYADVSAVHPGASHSVWTFQYGWPLRALQFQMYSVGGQRPYATWSFDWMPRWLNPTRSSLRQWPMRPLLTGMLINAVCYGACIWFVHRWSRCAVAHWRVWSGRCPMCGHMCDPPSGCPECGWRRSTGEAAADEAGASPRR